MGSEMCIRDSNQSYSPYRNQIYFKQTPQLDSQFCHAMALSNLVGQAAGVAVSPDDISYQAGKADTYNEGIGDLPFGIELPGGIKEDWQVLSKMGFCLQSDINPLLQSRFNLAPQEATYSSSQSIRDLGLSQPKWTIADMANALGKVCKNRISLPQTQLETISFEHSKDVGLLQSKIDTALDDQKYVAFSYNGHYVTIVGRTANCDYLIQDSIPKNFWESHEFEKQQANFATHGGAIEFLDEHLQRWPAATLSLIHI